MYKERELNDRMLLERVLEHEDEVLDEQTIQAFRGMKIRLEDQNLSSRQREWVARVYKEKDIQRHYNENRKGKVPRGKKQHLFSWEKPENRPLKPPGM